MHHALTCSNKTKSLNFSLDLDFKSIQQEWVALAGGQGAELGRRQDFCTALSDWFWQQTEIWSWMQNTPFPKVHSTSSACLGTPPWSPSVLGSRKHTKGVKNTKDLLEKVNIPCLEKFRSCYNGQYNKSLWKQSWCTKHCFIIIHVQDFSKIWTHWPTQKQFSFSHIPNLRYQQW